MKNFLFDNIYIIAATIFIVWLSVAVWMRRRKERSNQFDPTVLWLDDVRDPFKGKWISTITDGFPHLGDFEVVWVKDYNSFVSYIRFFGVPEAISFDHDLGPGQSGYDCAKWLVDYCIDHKVPLPQYRMHSSNPVGKQNILAYLANAEKHNKELHAKR